MCVERCASGSMYSMPSSPALKHFKKADKRLYKAALSVKQHLPTTFKHKTNLELFSALCESIVSQQLSVKAADTIWQRVKVVCKGHITPVAVLKAKEAMLRKAGMSFAKIKAIKSVAQEVENGLKLSSLRRSSPDIASARLIKIHGVGPWTAEMFLLFGLHHEDIFSKGDLGLVRAIEMIYEIKNPTAKKLDEISAVWMPYRSYASRVLWKYRDLKIRNTTLD